MLPAAYVARDVELPHGTTNNRSQGGTVDTAHSLITPPPDKPGEFVRRRHPARHHTTFYVVTHELPGMDPDDQLDRVLSDRRIRRPRDPHRHPQPRDRLSADRARSRRARGRRQGRTRPTVGSAGASRSLAPGNSHVAAHACEGQDQHKVTQAVLGLVSQNPWSGAGSNRRPSAFQADARTN